MQLRSIIALVAAVIVVRAVFAALLPFIEDEAYYSLWSEALAWGYYDHPPMVAWWIAAGRWLIGEGVFAARLLSVISAGVTTLLIWRATFIVTGDTGRAVLAALFFNVMMLVTIAAPLASPDAPSMLFWTASIWALLELVRSDNGRWWLVVGAMAGLGVLSKFTNLFFGLGLILWIATTPDARKWLTSPYLWASAGLVAILWSPLILWNMQNDFVGLERQFGRISQGGFQAERLFEFVLSQTVLVTPIILWLSLSKIGRHWRGPAAPVVITAVPYVVFLIFQATQTAVQGNWPLPLYPALAILAAASVKSPVWGLMTKVALGSAAALSAAACVAVLVPSVPVPEGHNPVNQTRGWQRFSIEIRAEARDAGAMWIATESYGLTSQLHHYIGDRLPVWSVGQPERYLFRGAIPVALCAAPGLLVRRSDLAATEVSGFASFESLAAIGRYHRGETIMDYRLDRVQHMLHPDCPG